MSVIGDVLNVVSQEVMPQIGVIAFPDTCNIQTQTPTQSTSGATIKGTVTNAYIDIPVAYKPLKNSFRQEQAGKARSVNEYVLTIPRADTDNVPIEFDIKKHRVEVIARGNHPAKTFRPTGYGNRQDVVMDIICELEN